MYFFTKREETVDFFSKMSRLFLWKKVLNNEDGKK